MSPTLIIITGHPGTGKTTLAHRLSKELNLPVLSKDEIKEVLFDVLGWTDVSWSKQISAASYRVIDHVMKELLTVGGGAIIESNFLVEFDSERIEALIRNYSIAPVQILLYSKEDVRAKRFHERRTSGNRHAGHHDLDQFQKNQDHDRRIPLMISAPRIEIDTTDFEKVDYAELLNEIRKACLDSDGTV
ncbi:MAG: AAA family ATPase [Patescibacteria group bacterium]